MTVKELIKLLRRGDPTDLVRVYGSIKDDGSGHIETTDADIKGGNHSVIRIDL